MKKRNLYVFSLAVSTSMLACNNGPNLTEATNTSDQTGNTVTNQIGSRNDTTGISGSNNSLLNVQDSTFAMKAAAGGMMEVEAGNAAQQKAQNSRVKAFGAMMVRDHSKSNQELITVLSGRMHPPRTLPQEHQNHLNALNKTSGATFDKQYMNMMVADHEKTIADFEKQASSGADAALKAFAAKTLPILRVHRDSAVAINQAIR